MFKMAYWIKDSKGPIQLNDPSSQEKYKTATYQCLDEADLENKSMGGLGDHVRTLSLDVDSVRTYSLDSMRTYSLDIWQTL